MSARKSIKAIQKAAPSLETSNLEKLSDILAHIFDDFIDAHALVKVAYRLIDGIEVEDRGAAVLVLGKGVEALDEFSDKLEQIRRVQKRSLQGVAS